MGAIERRRKKPWVLVLVCTWHAAASTEQEKKLYKQAEAKRIGTESILVKRDCKKNQKKKRQEWMKCRVYFVWRQNWVARIDSHRFVSHNVERGVWFSFNADTIFRHFLIFCIFSLLFILWLSSLLSSSSSFFYFHFRLHRTYFRLFSLAKFCRFSVDNLACVSEKMINVSVCAWFFSRCVCVGELLCHSPFFNFSAYLVRIFAYGFQYYWRRCNRSFFSLSAFHIVHFGLNFTFATVQKIYIQFRNFIERIVWERRRTIIHFL